MSKLVSDLLSPFSIVKIKNEFMKFLKTGRKCGATRRFLFTVLPTSSPSPFSFAFSLENELHVTIVMWLWRRCKIFPNKKFRNQRKNKCDKKPRVKKEKDWRNEIAPCTVSYTIEMYVCIHNWETSSRSFRFSSPLRWSDGRQRFTISFSSVLRHCITRENKDAIARKRRLGN